MFDCWAAWNQSNLEVLELLSLTAKVNSSWKAHSQANSIDVSDEAERTRFIEKNWPGKFVSKNQYNHAKSSINSLKRLELYDAYTTAMGVHCHFPNYKPTLGVIGLHALTVLFDDRLKLSMEMPVQRTFFIEALKFFIPLAPSVLKAQAVGTDESWKLQGTSNTALLDTFMCSRTVPQLLATPELIADRRGCVCSIC